MAMKGNDLLKGVRGGNWEALLLVLWALSPYSVEGVAAAKVCTTDSNGNTVCHDKLSGGAIAAIVITVLLVLLLCAGIYYVIRRTRLHSMNNSLSTTFVIPALGYSSRNRGRDEEERGDLDDDDNYLSVEKNQIQGPAWEARYDPSSAPLPSKGSSSWSSRLRSIKSGETHSGSEYGGFRSQPMSAPGFGHGRSHGMGGSGHGASASSVYSSVRKPRSAGADSSSMGMVSKGHSGIRHWGSLIHGSQSRNGSRSAGPGPMNPESAPPAPKQVRTRVPPGLDLTSGSPSGYYNPPVVPPITPHTPRTPSRLGTAPPLSAGPMGAGLASASIAPRTSRGAGASTPLTPRPVPSYSPVTPRGPVGAI